MKKVLLACAMAAVVGMFLGGCEKKADNNMNPAMQESAKAATEAAKAQTCPAAPAKTEKTEKK